MDIDTLITRHKQIGSVLGSCSLEPDYIPGLHSEQWSQVEWLLKEFVYEKNQT